jgi:hypothetical protein
MPFISEVWSEHVDIVEETRTQISFVPKLSQRQHGFQAVLRQYHDNRGTYNVIPRLSINNIIPADSLVFTLVKRGRMAEFQELLMSGKASLRDHDEYGTSLLFVSQLQSSQYTETMS